MKLLIAVLLCACCVDGFAATGRGVGRTATRGADARTWRAGADVLVDENKYAAEPVQAEEVVVSETPIKVENEQKKKEREICKANNIGVGNTFVWSARNANLDNYATMVEDVQNPENNACFVKVAIGSTDESVALHDFPTKYFEVGKKIVCGSWVKEEDLEKRILNAKKSARAWGTVASTVGGAGLGVGAMEVFGNRLIGGKVMGQKALEGQELLRSQVLELKKSNKTDYDRIVKALDELEELCADKELWGAAEIELPHDCKKENNPFIGLRKLLDD